MPKLLPTSMIGETTLSQNQNGQTFYYEVRFTVFGEVLSVEDDLSDLPPIAQKLILGEKKETTSKELQLGLNNLKYLVPLIALGETHALPQWLTPVEMEIRQMQKAIPPEIKNNPEQYIKTDWLKQLVGLDPSSKIYNRRISKYFVNLMLEKGATLNIHHLSPIESVATIEYLIEEAKKCWEYRKSYHSKIKQLSKISNQLGYRALVSIIFNASYQIEARISAINAIGKMSCEDAEFPLTAALADDNYWIRVYAVKALTNFINKIEIADTLLNTYLQDENPWVRVRAVQALGLIENDTALMDTLAQQLKILDNEEIIFHTVEALKRMDCPYSRNLLRQYY